MRRFRYLQADLLDKLQSQHFAYVAMTYHEQEHNRATCDVCAVITKAGRYL